MALDFPHTFWFYFAFAALLFVDGLWCMLATRNLLRVLIGLEILMKSVTFFLIVAGYLSDRMALAQAIVITVIVIEVVVVVAAAGIILGFFRRTETLDVKNAREMKG